MNPKPNNSNRKKKKTFSYIEYIQHTFVDFDKNDDSEDVANSFEGSEDESGNDSEKSA